MSRAAKRSPRACRTIRTWRRDGCARARKTASSSSTSAIPSRVASTCSEGNGLHVRKLHAGSAVPRLAERLHRLPVPLDLGVPARRVERLPALPLEDLHDERIVPFIGSPIELRRPVGAEAELPQGPIVLAAHLQLVLLRPLDHAEEAEHGLGVVRHGSCSSGCQSCPQIDHQKKCSEALAVAALSSRAKEIRSTF